MPRRGEGVRRSLCRFRSRRSPYLQQCFGPGVSALNNSYKNEAGVRVPFAAVPSVPNFELWLLLHFKSVLAPIHRTEVYAELKKPAFYPTYAKNSATVYDDTKGNIGTATQRATHLRESFNPADGSDPYTDIDLVANKLLSIPVPWG
ncbi:RloB domain-containing protein [Mesorhizobium sophorae]|uniref:RloB domain-containing protein n=1 Tax=Mesorhizobium sophorae TaxID=1300294 RepID=UPI003CCA59E0